VSVHYEASRDRYVVRWRQDGRNRTRRFRTADEAATFDQQRRKPTLAAPTRAVEVASGGDGIYPYETSAGLRFRFLFRQSDGKLSSRRGFMSRQSAATARRRLVESIERGEVKVARETFEEFWKRLLEERRPYLTKGSFEDFQTHGHKRLLPILGATPLARIDEPQVRRWMAEMVGRVEAGELAPKTVNNARTCLSVALNEACRRGLLSRNPCVGVPALPVDRAELDYLCLEEIGPYLDACTAHYRPLAEFLIGTGARISEALDVRFRHLELEHGAVRIYRQRGRDGQPSQPTKGKRFRAVQAGPELCRMLAELRDRTLGRRGRLAVPLPGAATRALRRTDRADAAEPQDRARLARSGPRRRRPARHATARAAPQRGRRLARDRPSADLRAAPARPPLDHDDRGALRAPGVVVRPRGRRSHGVSDRVSGQAGRS